MPDSSVDQSMGYLFKEYPYPIITHVAASAVTITTKKK
jgi:hypothetical protein